MSASPKASSYAGNNTEKESGHDIYVTSGIRTYVPSAIYVTSGIRTYVPSAQAFKDSPCRGLLDHCDRLNHTYYRYSEQTIYEEEGVHKFSKNLKATSKF
jgi:hypothetical protein